MNKNKNMGEIENNRVIVLFEGYSTMSDPYEMHANCSCVLIKGEHFIIVDTMTPWDSDRIITALSNNNVMPDEINYVISTHGHSDHIGNNNLFLKAKHIVGFSFSFQDSYFLHPFDKGEEYVINSGVTVIPTPGHTLADVSVVVKSKDEGVVAITGDLFEKLEDIENPNIWREAGSEDPEQQIRHRSSIADIADWIIPGHGPKFRVTDEIRDSLQRQACTNYRNKEP